MYLENIVVDALEPQRLGRFWEAALGTETLTDEPEGYETRLAVPDGPVLDLCFQRVPGPVGPQRLHLDLLGGAEQRTVVEHLVGLGAEHADIGQGDVPWVVLADPEGNPFCVLEERAAYAGTGMVAALVLDVADPEREQAFWSWLTGWVPVDESGLPGLRHPSHRGPFLELRPEPQPKNPDNSADNDEKNRMHLDLRLEADDDVDALAREIADRGGREVLHPEWGELPWRFFQDPSGNEFCLLAARG